MSHATSAASTSARPQPASHQGDPTEAIAALFDEHCDFVCRVLTHHGLDDAALDDAVQDVFVTAYRRWSSFEGRSSARSWLFGIARRIASRHRRKEATRERYLDPAGDTVGDAGANDPFAQAHAAHSLAALLRQIDRDKRSVFVLRELEGMTAPEISEALDVPVGTVYSRLRAAWKGLGEQAERERARLRRIRPDTQGPAIDADRRRRLWGTIAGSLAPAAAPLAPIATATSTVLGSLKWAVIGGALALGLVGARALISPTEPTTNPPPRHADATLREPMPASPPAQNPADPADDRRATPEANTAGTATPQSPPPTIDPPPRTRTRRPGPPPSTSATPPDRPADAHAPPATPSLQRELALLRGAQKALSAGQPTKALQLLDEHSRDFPRGQLVTERRSTRIKTLCALDRRPQAAAEADAAGLDFDRLCPQ